MATAQQNGPGSQSGVGFDGRKLADLIGLIDSPVEAEAAGAVHRIRVLKKKHGDVPFYELVERPDYKAAVWEKFGGCAAPCGAGSGCHHGPAGLRGWFETKHGSGNSAELIEARTLVEKLRQDNAQLEQDGAALALAVKRQEDIISTLRQKATARPVAPVAQAVGAAGGGPAREFVGWLFAFGFVMGAAALLFVGVWRLAAAVFGGRSCFEKGELAI